MSGRVSKNQGSSQLNQKKYIRKYIRKSLIQDMKDHKHMDRSLKTFSNPDRKNLKNVKNSLKSRNYYKYLRTSSIMSTMNSNMSQKVLKN